jgi:hypothetical protein
MIKFLTIGILLFVLYRFVVQPKTLNEAPREENLNSGEEEFVDYEEVD